jgi:hypothetical protein
MYLKKRNEKQKDKKGLTPKNETKHTHIYNVHAKKKKNVITDNILSKQV